MLGRAVLVPKKRDQGKEGTDWIPRVCNGSCRLLSRASPSIGYLWHPVGYLRYPIHDVAEKMIKSPRNIKYTKYQKNYTHSRGTPAKRSTSVDFGTYGLQCNEPTMLSLKQLETCRRTLRRVVARRAPIWIRAFPYKPLYKKEQGQRIGKGKGDRSDWVCPIRKGQIILEVGGQIDISVVRQVFSTISYQLGVPTKLVKKTPL